MTNTAPDDLARGSTRELMESIHTAAKDVSSLVNPAPAPVGTGAIVIFGAGGDLTKRKLIPSLYNLAAAKLLNDEVAVIAVARSGIDDATWRARLAEEMAGYATGKLDPAVRDWLVRRSYYVNGDFDDPATYERLTQKLAEVDQTHKTKGNRLFYFATAPEYFGVIATRLGEAKLSLEFGRRGGETQASTEEDGRWRRVIVEKPFGTNLTTARALNKELRRTLREEQIYRIDHYLGKETVQNLMVFRFGNCMFEPIWNRRYIDNVQITVAESIGVEARGGYYDTAGCLRDMVPNHLLQLLSLVAMEPPTSFEAEAVREEKAKVLRAIQPMSSERVLTNAVRGQYGAGTIAGGEVPDYRSEQKVDPQSSTETFVALKLAVDSWRWADVPFYMRTGKRLPRRVSEIAIQFRRPPTLLFRNTQVEHLSRNVLVIRVQPDEGIALRFGAKLPGPEVRMGNVAMEFKYSEAFGSTPSTGYETLIYDCIKGDATLFQRADMVEMGWSIVNPIQELWHALPAHEFPNYAAGAWGPWAADELLARDGRSWREIEG